MRAEGGVGIPLFLLPKVDLLTLPWIGQISSHFDCFSLDSLPLASSPSVRPLRFLKSHTREMTIKDDESVIDMM